MIEKYATSQKLELDYFLHVAPKVTPSLCPICTSIFIIRFEKYAKSQKSELEYFCHVAPKATEKRLAFYPFII